MLELTNTIPKDQMTNQILDNMDIERERGITIKLQPVQMHWKAYTFNLIDTPGHVDFNYEVSRSLAAVEGALLLVDATQGIQAQTINNFNLALTQGLTIVPVINKIDLPGADIEAAKQSLVSSFGFKDTEILLASGKEGTGVAQILDKIIELVPAPKTDGGGLRALIFDSQYDNFKGVLAYLRVMSGEIKKGDKLYLMGSHAEADVIEVGIFSPSLKPLDKLQTGEIGYVATGLKDVSLCRVGDTLTLKNSPAASALPGYKEIKPMVFAAFYPIDPNEFEALRVALGKLKLTDSAITYEPESSAALGSGFRCGFLGLLHLEVVQERLEREYDLSLIVTSPTVNYKIETTNNETESIQNPTKLPSPSFIKKAYEPWVQANISLPSNNLGSVLELVNQKRGQLKDLGYLGNQVNLKVEIPLSEVIVNFFDTLKSITSGYGSMDYELSGYKEAEITKLQIMVNGSVVDALSSIVPTQRALSQGRMITQKLREAIPRSQIEVAIQATINGKIIARETIKAFRKDVIAKLYGGDVTRKNKLLDKQREGKKKMKMVGKVEIPQEAFLSVLKNSPN